jgi:hypothetical protein
MERIIRKGLAVGLLLTTLVITLSSTFSASLAKSPKPGVVSVFDNSVGGEPGEDPHLKIDSDAAIVPFLEADGSGGDLTTRGDQRNPRDIFDSGGNVRSSRSSRYILGLKMVLQQIMWALSR